MATASVALAQTTTGPTPPPEGAAQPTEIVVTGSRIARRDYVSDSPIVTMGQAAVQASGSPTLETSLNQLPQIAPSASASANFTARGGQASVDLRGLGQQRTLVLLDGQRMQPSGSDGSVDLNVIPPSLIDSAEVITGGASAIYGSDAVTGVVNFKLKKHFVGAEIDAQYGVTQEGDGATTSITGTLGGDFADHKGNAFISASYSNRDPVKFTDRNYLLGQDLVLSLPQGLVNVVANNLPTQAAVNAVFSKYGVTAGKVPNTSQFSFNTDGSLFVQPGLYNYKGPLTGEFENYNNTMYVSGANDFLAQTPLTRYSLFGRGTYDINDNIQAYGQVLYTNYQVQTSLGPVVAGSSSSTIPLTIPVTNPFIPADFQTLLQSRPSPNAPFTIYKFIDAAGDRYERDDYNVYQVSGGFSGKLPGRDITWNVYASYGRTEYQATEGNYVSLAAMNKLLQAADGGSSICAGGYNPFGTQATSTACANYIRRTSNNFTTLEQRIVEGDVQGHLFNLPAGEARFSAGLDYRYNSYNFQPDSEIASGDIANYLPVSASNGSEDAYELYGELLLPVLRNLPLIKEFNVDLGYRYSDYNTVGGVSTYKADFDWRVINDVRLRGGYAHAIRAPSVGELYTASQSGQTALGSPGVLGSGDPCDVRGAYRAAGSVTAAQVRALCLAQGVPANLIDSYVSTNPRTPYQTSGNTDLQPETSDTYSFGIVWRPSFHIPVISRPSVSIDYYDIEIDKAIGLITNTVATSQCFNPSVNPGLSNANYYCGLIARDPASGQIALIQNPTLNLASYKTSGIDFEVEFSIAMADIGLDPKWGRLTFTSVANYLQDFKIQNLPTSPSLDYSGTIGNIQIDQFADAHPTWKATSSVSWDIGKVTSSLRWRYIDSMANAANVGTNGTASGVAAVNYFDLDEEWRVTSRISFTAGVINLGNLKPPVLNTSPVGQYFSDPYTYDLVGRRFYVALKARF